MFYSALRRLPLALLLFISLTSYGQMSVSFQGPSQNQTGIPLDANINLGFGETVNQMTVDNGTPGVMSDDNIQIFGSLSGQIAGTFSGGGTMTITFDPTIDFRPGEKVTVHVNDAVLSTTPTPATPTFLEFFVEGGLATGNFPNLTNITGTTSLISNDIELGDLDNDGNLDLVTATSAGVYISLGDGTGNFGAGSVETAAFPAAFVELADFNLDGFLDLVVATENGSPYTVDIYLNDGVADPNLFSATPSSTVSNVNGGINPFSGLGVADFTRDGVPDVIFGQLVTTAGAVEVHEVEGSTGTFFSEAATAPGNANARDFIIGDFDNNGTQDFVLPISSGASSIYFNNSLGVGDPSFSNMSSGIGIEYGKTADFNLDGSLDLAYFFGGDLQVRAGNGTGTPSFPVGYSNANDGTKVAVGDINGDDFVDIVTAGGGTVTRRVYLNQGALTFTIQNLSSLSFISDVSLGDVDNDGIVDAAFVESSGTALNRIALGEPLPSTLTVQNANDSGVGSLREAIAGIAPGGTIFFDPSLDGVPIQLSTILDVRRDVNFDGGGQDIILSGDTDDSGTNNLGDTQILSVDEGYNVSFTDITFEYGYVDGDIGGALQINAGAYVSLTQCTFRNNVAVNANGAAAAIGVGLADIDVDRCVFEDNTAFEGGGAIYLIANDNSTNTANIYNSTFINNTATNAGSFGGAIIISSGGSNTPNNTIATIYNCTFDSNSADGDGGALFLGNSVSIPANSNTFTLSNNTFYNNNSVTSNLGDDIYVGAESDLSLYNTIVASTESTAISVDALGTISASSNNIIAQQPSTFGAINSGTLTPAEIINTTLVPGPFGSYLELSPSSPAFDAGTNAQVLQDILDIDDDFNTSENTPFDAAGNPREWNPATTSAGTVDIGAVESQDPPAVTVTFPNGGESFYEGEIVTITWNEINVSPTEVLEVEYSLNGGSSYTFLTDNQAQNFAGQYNWTVPADISSNVIVRVSNTNDAILDVSDAPFDLLGPAQNSLAFDGSDDFVDIPDAASLDITGALTVETWVKFNEAIPAEDVPLVTKWNENGDNRSYLLQLNNSGDIQFAVSATGLSTTLGTDISTVVTPFTFQTGRWYHLAGVFTPGISLEVYVNGELYATETANMVSTINSGTSPVALAAFGNSFDNNSVSTGGALELDEVRVWSTNLDEATIQSQIDIELTGSEGNLVAYYDFNTVSGTTVLDLTSNANDGTLFNDWDDAVPANGSTTGPIWTTSTVFDTDVISPFFTPGYPQISNLGASGFDIDLILNEPSRGYFVVVADGAPAPNSPEVLAGTGSGGSGQLASGNSPTASSSFTLNATGLSAGTDYDVYVVAADDEGIPNVQGVPTQLDVTTASPPLAPTNLIAYDLGGDIELEWTDNATNETGFRIERAEDYAFTVNVTDITADAGNPGIDATFATYTPSAPPYDFYYRVTAINGFEDATSESSVEFGYNAAFPGNSLDFDGSDDFIDVPSPDQLRLATDLTVSAWVNIASGASGDMDLIGFGQTANNRAYAISLVDNADGTFSVKYLHEYNSGLIQEYTFSNVLSTNFWYHIALSRDNTANTVELYVNGVTNDVFNYTNDPNNLSVSNPFVIGGTSGAYYEGQLDAIRIWDIAKTDFSDRYSGLIGDEPNLIANYSFDEGTGATHAVDQSQNTNDGLLNGSITSLLSSAPYGPPPAPPTNFIAYESGGNIMMQWTDNATDETGYKVEVADDYAFATNVSDITIVSGNPGVDATTATFNASGTDYYYRVTAINGLGDHSSQSSVEFATTDAFPESALDLDGTDDYVETSLFINYANFQNMTWEFWLNPDVVTGTWTILSADDGGFDWGIYINNGEYVVQSGSGSLSTGIAADQNQWQHIAVAFTSTDITVYKNGVSLYSNSIDFSGSATSNPLNIGRNPGFPGSEFDGQIDEVKIWEDSTKSNFSDRFSPAIGNEPKLAAYYPFDEGVGATHAIDRSINTYDGILNGGVNSVTSTIFTDGVVINTNDSGLGSLRAAIDYANANPSTTITFDIAGVGPWNIDLQSALPQITANNTIIDGTTQQGWAFGNGATMVTIDGSAVPVNNHGIDIDASGVEVYGMIITGFTGGTTYGAINLESDVADNVTIGGNAAGNVIHGNGVNGIYIDGADGATIQGNWIGTDDGTSRSENTQDAISVTGTCDNLTIGGNFGSGLGNVISGAGNGSYGITTVGGGSNLLIQGNYIGTSSTGNAQIYNEGGGINIGGTYTFTIGGVSAGLENIVSGNNTDINADGIVIGNSSTGSIQNNIIGLAANGNALGNGGNGIALLAGSNNVTVSGNTLSSNGAAGIAIGGGTVNDHTVTNNIIGLTSDGLTPRGNTTHGINVSGTSGTNITITGNTIGANLDDGIHISMDQTGLDISGNHIGVDINGNGNLSLDTDGVTVLTDNPIGNKASGIYLNVIDGSSTNNSITNNTISGNGIVAESAFAGTGSGITINLGVNNVTIQGNRIGVEADGVTKLKNINSAIYINSPGSNSGLIIGGEGVGEENILGYSGDYGIQLVGTESNNFQIYANEFICNEKGGISYNSTPDIDAPVITFISPSSISGTTTAEDNSNIFIYEADTCAFDQGKLIVSAIDAVSGGSWTIGSGSFDPTKQYLAVVVDDEIAGIRSTSEFSAPASIPASVVTNTNDTGIGSLREAINYANANPGTTITFDISSGPYVINLGSALPQITANNTIIDGTTLPAWSFGSAATMVTINGSGIGGNANGINIDAANVEVYGLILTGFSGNSTNGNIYLASDAADFAIIGGSGTGNIIHGSGGNAIYIVHGDSAVIRGNRIGTLNGSTLSAIGDHGIATTGEIDDLIIGGDFFAGEGNLISGAPAFRYGLNLFGSGGGTGLSNVEIKGNKIGTNDSANGAIANTLGGINILGTVNGVEIGGPSPSDLNIISGNGDHGIIIQAGNTFDIDGNYIGLQSDGSSALGNAGSGIRINGAAVNVNIGTISQNLISENAEFGIVYDGNTSSNTALGTNIFSCNANGGIGYGSGPLTPGATIDAMDFGTALVSTAAADGSSVYVYYADDGCSNDQGIAFAGTGVVSSGQAVVSGGFAPNSHYVALVEDVNGYSTFSSPYFANFVMVTNTNDTGTGSFRAAIDSANLYPGASIYFNIAGGAPWVINLASDLPNLSAQGTIIDATTQPGWDISTGEIPQINGGGTASIGLNFTSNNEVEVYGLHIDNFTVAGIRFNVTGGTPDGYTIGAPSKGNIITNSGSAGISILSYLGGGTIQGNYIGIMPDSTAGWMSNTNGISLGTNADNAQIGGLTPGEENVISNNTTAEISISGGDNAIVQGNILGLTPDESAAAGAGNGININGSDGATIEQNVISGHTTGIRFNNSSGHTVIRNNIGVSSDGSTPFPNSNGIHMISNLNSDNNIIGSNTITGDGNIIAENTTNAILIEGSGNNGNQIQRNSIYNNAAGITLGSGAHNGILPPAIDPITVGSTVSGTGTNGDEIDLYYDDSNGQGNLYLGSATVSGGTWSIGSLSLNGGDRVVATATNATDGTSEFSTAATFTFNYPIAEGAGEALYFDGVDDYVEISSLDVDGWNEILVEAWIKPDDIPNGPGNQYATIVGKGSYGPAGNTAFALYLFGSDASPFSELRARVDNGSQVEEVTYDANNLFAGEWVHVAMSWTSGNSVELYVNGVLVDSSSPLSGTINSVGDNILIGSSSNGSELLFEGEIDEVKIWDKRLQENGIRQYLAKKVTDTHPDYSNLVAYYRMDDSGDALNLNDFNGVNNGTINGGMSYVLSGAHLGNDSFYDYLYAVGEGRNLDNFRVTNLGTANLPLHIYRVSGTPANNTISGFDNIADTAYYGVFAPGQTYDVSDSIGNLTSDRRIVFRNDGADPAWTSISGPLGVDLDDDQVFAYGQSGSGQFATAIDQDPYPTPVDAGYALRFDGVDDEVIMTGGDTYEFIQNTGVFSFEFWLKINDLTQLNQTIASTAFSTVHRGFFINYANTGYNAQSLRIAILRGASGQYVIDANTPANYVDDTNWHHYAIVSDGSNLTIYKDGVPTALGAIGTLSAGPATNDFALGTYDGQAGSILDGDLDEVRIWEIPLSETNIRDHMIGKIDADFDSLNHLVAYYRFDENSGSVATNLAGDSDGTVTGATPVISGAPQGQGSIYSYEGTPGVLNTAQFGEDINVYYDDATGGIHGYVVQGNPNQLQADGFDDLDQGKYYGVFAPGGQKVDLRMDYNGANDPQRRIVYRKDATDNAASGGWERLSGLINTSDVADSVFAYNVPTGEVSTAVLNPPSSYPVLSNSDPGSALSFDGVDDYVQSPSDLLNHSEGTIEAWVKLKDVTGFNDILGYGVDQNNYFVVSVENGLINHFLKSGGTIHWLYSADSGNELDTATWYHLAFVHDGVSPSMYINGVAVPQTLTGGVGNNTNYTDQLGAGNNLLIGAGQQNTIVNFFDGEIDEVRIWNAELSAGDIAAFANTTDISTHPNYSDMVAYYKFDDGTGSTILEDVFANNDGTLTNMDENTDWVGSGALANAPQENALNFDGTDDYLSFTRQAFPTGLTYEAWINTSSAANTTLYNGNPALVVVGDNDNSVEGAFGVHDGKVRYTHWTGSGIIFDQIDGTVTVNDGLWHHIAVTHEQGSNEVRLYVDGILDTIAYTTNYFTTVAANRIGSSYLNGSGNDNFFAGDIDEVRIWDSVIDEADIRAFLYNDNLGSHPNNANLVLHYNFNQGDAGNDNAGETAVLDQSSNTLDGTLNGFTLNGASSNFISSNAFVHTPSASSLQASNITVSNVTESSADITWNNGDGQRRIVALFEGIETEMPIPSDNQFFNADPMFMGDGDIVDGTWYAVYNGYGDSVSVTGLNAGQDYTVAVLEVNGPAGQEAYNSGADTDNPVNFSTNVANSNFALDFDGINDQVQVASPTGFPVGSAPRTLELWIKSNVDLTSDTDHGIVQYGTTLNGQMFGLITSSNAPGKLYFFGNNADLAGVTDLVQDQWYHVAITYDGTDLNLYLDGNLEATSTEALNTVMSGEGLTIGRRAGLENFWDGQIDEVRLWDYARTETEIQEDMNNQLFGNEPGLVAYYPFLDGTGSTNVTDITIGSNDGTLIDMDENTDWVAGPTLNPPTPGPIYFENFNEDPLPVTSNTGYFLIDKEAWNGQGVLEAGSANAVGSTGNAMQIEAAGGNFLQTPTFDQVNTLAFWLKGDGTGGSYDIYLSDDGGETFTNLYDNVTTTASYEEYTGSLPTDYTGPIRIVYESGTSPLFVDDLSVDGEILYPEITISTISIGDQTYAQGEEDALIYKVRADVANSLAVFEGLYLVISGADSLDFQLDGFKYYQNIGADDFASATLMDSSSWSPGDPVPNGAIGQLFTDFYPAGTSVFYYVTADISGSAALGTFTVDLPDVDNFGFGDSEKLDGGLTAGDNFTIQAPTIPDATFSTIPVAGGDLDQGSADNLIYQFSISASGGNITKNGMIVAVGGDAISSDFSANGWKLYESVNTDTGIGGASLIASTNIGDVAADSVGFPMSGDILDGDTHYFYIAVDIDAAATPDHAFNVVLWNGDPTESIGLDDPKNKVDGGFVDGNTFTIQDVDTTSPTPIISTVEVSPTNANPIPIEIDFGESVVGFDSTDLVIGNGTAQNFVDLDGQNYTVDIVPAADGVITVDIADSVAQDLAGNENLVAAQFSIEYDGSGPSITFDQDGLTVNDTNLSGTISDTTDVIQISVDGGSTLSPASNEGDGTWSYALNADPNFIGDGTYTIYLDATDTLGNQTIVSTGTVTIDQTGPSITFDQDGQTLNVTDLSGTTSDVNDVIQISLDAGSTLTTATNNGDGTWSYDISTDPNYVGNGAYGIYLDAADSLGNQTILSTGTVTIDLLGPAITFAQDAQTTNDTNISGTISDPTDAILLSLDTGNTLSAVTNNGDGTWSYDLSTDPNFAGDGLYNIYLDATDTLGNQTINSSGTVTIDQTAPIIDVDLYGTSISSPQVTGTIDDPTATIEVTVNGETNPATNVGDGTWVLAAGVLSDLDDGTYEVQATATDLAGNVGTDPSSEELVISQDITALKATQITPTSFRANWSEGLDVQSYQLDVSTESDFSSFVSGYENLSVPATSRSITVSGLDFSSSYYYRVRLVNTASQVSSNSNTRSVKTSVDLPTLADSLALVQIYDAINPQGLNWESARLRDWDGITLDANRTRVNVVNISGTQAAGDMPNPFTGDALANSGLSEMTGMDASTNQITGLMDFSATSISTLFINENALQFDDLEPVVALGITTLDYSDQESISYNEATSGSAIEVRYSNNYTLSITVGGSSNEYAWFRNDVSISSGSQFGIGGPEAVIQSIDYDNMGEFRTEVTNPLVPGLTLNVDPQIVWAVADMVVSVVDGNGDPLTDPIDGYMLEAVRRSQGFDTLEVVLDAPPSTFTFPDVVLGNYITAINSNPELYIPTYFGDVFEWGEADTLFFRSDDVITMTMTEVPDELTEGPGTLDVLIEEDFGDENTRIDARRRAAKRKCGLRKRRRGGRTGQDDDEFELIAYGETDENGEFQFGFLPSGTYRFFVEYPGIPLDESSFVQFEVGEEGISDTDFKLQAFATEEGIQVEIEAVLGVILEYFKDLSIFPNPSREYLNIRYRHLKSSDVTAQLVDLSGNTKWSTELRNGFDGELRIDVSGFEEGVYILRFYDRESPNENVVSFRVIVRN
ncbi:LamG-like jellyroll fold domain-containing protein [Ekhidna sp.]|uniref:LamG-like jellyroll fold domain-containing protein n=1 Tax=Ekhidna sp. TaxID=2608089 RepID=UPI003CCBDF69